MDPSQKSNKPPAIATPTAPTGSSPTLGLDLNKIALMPDLKRSIRSEQTLFNNTSIYTEYRFLIRLREFHSCDVLTYTYSSQITRYIVPSRVIFSVGPTPLRCTSCRVTSTHAKLFICYTSPRCIEPVAFIGSANATDMTLHELMVQLTPAQSSLALQHFNKLWELNK